MYVGFAGGLQEHKTNKQEQNKKKHHIMLDADDILW